MLLNNGCAIYEMETTNRGGYIDYVLDKHWLKADSKSMRALRAFAMQVSLARLASVSAKNESDRQLLAIRIGALTKRFMPIYLCAFNENPLAVEGAEHDPCFYYDSAMVDYSTGLFDLAMIALPIEDAKRLVTVATGSAVNPINLIDLLDALLQIGKDAIKYGRVVGALYRDTVELEVQVWLTTPAIDNRDLSYRVTVTDVQSLYDVYARGNDNMPAWIAEMAALRARGLEPIPQRKFFFQLAGLMNYICDLITVDPRANNSDTCKANLPKTAIAPVAALGSAGSLRIGDVIRANTLVRSADAADKGKGGRSVGEALKDADKMFADYSVKEYPISVVRQLQNALCVPTSEVGKVGETTKAHILIFESTNMVQASDNNLVRKDGLLDVNERDVLRKSAECPRTKALNFYERGRFGDGNDAATRKTLDETIIPRLNSIAITGLEDLPAGATLPLVRTRIKLVRGAMLQDTTLAKDMIQLPASMSDQWTPDLAQLLKRK
ncbi:hypothetical protein CVM73_13405 [Bradyrhizobium forestalis]|uniref:Uncharacterized protein n=1 Tax=Bradyrhizobium forestalis TaxID=1419263 RepID=A0A2M8RA01_9BRAD|nr:hypothetical protein CVM73_13405 [Bradyrhizobium forestalis]